jgi:NAD+ diphosphatase
MDDTRINDRFTPSIQPPETTPMDAILFIARGFDLLVKDSAFTFPTAGDFSEDILSAYPAEYLGEFDGSPCYCLTIPDSMTAPEGMFFKNLRELLGVLEESVCLLALKALHIANWSSNNRFCGACGHPTENSKTERAKVCTNCGNTVYPRISPAIIIAIVNEDKLLLAHNSRFPGNRYSVIAGFIEPGETFEDAARREALEEVGVKIKNIRYFGSQPWPFPDSLMIGLTADYDGGEITPDGEEIDQADWYGAEELPQVPGTVSIAGRLIEWFVRGKTDIDMITKW